MSIEIIFLIFSVICLVALIAIFLFFMTTGHILKKGKETAGKGLGKVRRKITLPLAVQNSLGEARRYGKSILQAEQQCAPNQRKRLTSTVKSVNTLLANLNRLEINLERLYQKHNLSREIKQTHSEIEDLKKQIQIASGQQVKILKNLVNTKQKHLSALNMLQDFQKRMELTIRHNASTLKSTHTEVTLLVAKGNIDNNKFRRLNQDLQENSANLMDLLEAIDEVDREIYIN